MALYAATHSYSSGFAETDGADAAIGLSYSGLVAAGVRLESPSLSAGPNPVTVTSQNSPPPTASSRLASDEETLRLAASRSPSDQQAPAPLPPASTDPPCDRDVSPLYCVYTVRPGDTLSKISSQFGLKGSEDVAPWDLLVQSNKPDITSADEPIQPGQKLRVPLKNGIVHVVLTGETASELARDYGVAATAIETPSGPATTLTIGQEVLIANPARIPAPRVGSSEASPSTTAAPSGTPVPDGTQEPAPGGGATAVPPPIASGTAGAVATPRPGAATATRTPTPGRGTPSSTRSTSGFIWPATGPISSYYGPSHPLGIDIDLYANPTGPIVASAAGTVTFAGGNTCCSYGLYVVIDHGNGYSTLYAHFSSISVVAGQKVAQGQVLGNGGRTGYATGNHLHFEVRLNDAIINPLTVLP